MRVVVTSRRFPDRDPYGDIVAEYGGSLAYGTCATEADAIAFCEDADVIVGGFVPVTGDVMDAAGDPEAILVHAAGYDAVDVRAATCRGIPVANAPGYAPDDISSHAMALLLAAAHRIVPGDRNVRAETGWEDRTVHPVHGGTMGIVGFGHIGRALVEKARGFDMDVIAHDPHVPDDVFAMQGVEQVRFEELLARSDCISIHAALTDVTAGMFGPAAFERMREDAVLVNTARGPIVQEDALVAALEAGELRAAGLDVFEEEPPTDSPLFERDDVVLTPHTAGGTERAEENVIALMCAELRRVFDGDPLENVVNPAVYQYRGHQVTVPDDR